MNERQAAELVPMANKLWDRMRDLSDKKVAITHDTYLKIWALSKPQLPYDAVILDEAQDTNPVTASVLEAQRKAQLLIIGDRHQSIYAFRGSTNAMERFAALTEATVYTMPRTWRFGARSAALANVLLDHFKNETTPIIGMGQDAPYTPNAPIAYLSRSNMELFAKAASRRGVGMHWVGGCNNYRLELVMDAYHLFSGDKQKVQDFMLKRYDSWPKFEEAVGISQDVESRILLKVVETYGHSIPDLIQDIRNNEVLDPANAERIMTTAHKAKGLDWDYVKLGDDFSTVTDCLEELQEKGRLSAGSLQEINLLYVALTRAKKCVFLNEDSKQLLDMYPAYAERMENPHGTQPLGKAPQARIEPSLDEEAADFAHAALATGDAEMLADFKELVGVSAQQFDAMTSDQRLEVLGKSMLKAQSATGEQASMAQVESPPAKPPAAPPEHSARAAEAAYAPGM